MIRSEGILLPVIFYSSAQIIVAIDFRGLIGMDGIHVDESAAARTEMLELNITADLVELGRGAPKCQDGNPRLHRLLMLWCTWLNIVARRI